MKQSTKEVIYKMLNKGFEKVDQKNFIVMESWKKTKARLQEKYPTAKIKYSYKTQQFTIEYNLPADFKLLNIISKGK